MAQIHERLGEILNIYGLKNMQELRDKLAELKNQNPESPEIKFLEFVLWSYDQELDFHMDEITLIIKALLEHVDKLKQVEGAPKEDAEAYKKLIEKFMAYREVYFNKENWLDALLKVGPAKPLGYYHAMEIEDYGYSFDDIKKMAEQRGLKTRKFSGGFSGESIYFYDEAALQHLLDVKASHGVLAEASWPTEAGEFVDRVSQEAVEPGSKLFALIGKVFGDERFIN